MRVRGGIQAIFIIEPDPHQTCNERWVVRAFLADPPPEKKRPATAKDSVISVFSIFFGEKTGVGTFQRLN